MISVGPFSIRIIMILSAVIVAWLVTRLFARSIPDVQPKIASGLIFDALIVGLLIGRISFVLVWWSDYIASPWAILAMGDGGFYAVVGIPAAVVWLGWKTRKDPRLRKPVYMGVLVGLIVWSSALGGLKLLQQSAPSLPEIELSTLDSQPLTLTRFSGQPVVVNLWASWCPPCRKEMPVFAQAQAEYPGIAILMVNQGESLQTITTFLASEGLELGYVLLDPAAKVMREFGAHALPTTLFFDAEGKMVHSHMGEITLPSLKNTINKTFAK